jgi:hypothetical protein
MQDEHTRAFLLGTMVMGLVALAIYKKNPRELRNPETQKYNSPTESPFSPLTLVLSAGALTYLLALP